MTETFKKNTGVPNLKLIVHNNGEAYDIDI